MKKAYIQPEAELLTLSSLEDFLNGSTTVPGGSAGDDFAGGTDGDDFDKDPWA